jgi:glycosyltransferase involved in cell wall biosynthesis
MHLVAAVAHAMARMPSSALVLKMTNPVERPNKNRLSNLVRRKWYGWAFGRANKVLVIADATRAELALQYPQIGAKLRVVDNPYITEAMIEAGRSASKPERGRLLAIGRLVSQKNYPLLLRALAQISTLDWTLDILGDGPQLAPLQSQAGVLGFGDRIRFRGFVTDPVPYLRSAHALVLSSAWEGQGAVLLEALASGCPVIATHSTAAVGDVLANGLYGTLTPAGDEAALADAIAAELERRTILPPSTSAWVSRYAIDAGVKSHLKALDLDDRTAFL